MTDQFRSASEQVAVRIDSPAGLVAALPAILGFTPAESLVVLGFTAHDDRLRLGVSARVDLDGIGDCLEDVTRAVVDRVGAGTPAQVALIVIRDDGGGGVEAGAAAAQSPPREELATAVATGFGALGVECPTRLWVPRIAAGARWRCYDRCACGGVLPDPQASEAAAHTALLGRAIYRDRGEVEASLTADPDAESPRRRELLAAACLDAVTARTVDAAAARRRDLGMIRGAIAALAAGQRPDEALTVRIAAALGDPSVRDVCLGFALGADARVDPAGAAPLWQTLTRALPAHAVADPATLYAFAVLLREGGGAALSVALERARRADPGHRLSGLLDQMLAAGIGLAQITEIVRGAAADAAAAAES